MKGKVALITGGSRGIGKAIAAEFVKRGAYAVIAARSGKDLTSTAKKMGKSKVLPLRCDVLLENEVKSLVETAFKWKKRIDILVNNAGIALESPVRKMKTADWDLVLNTNLRGAFLVTKYALPRMIKKRGGHIFNISSIAGKQGFEDWSAYCASKFGMLGFNGSLREEVRKYGIKVTAVLPGAVDTVIWESVGGVSASERKKMIRPEEIARLTAEAASQSAKTLTEEITVSPMSSGV